MRYNACFSVVKASKEIDEATRTHKISFKEAFDTKAGSSLAEAAIAHTHYYIFNSFFEKIVVINDENTR